MANASPQTALKDGDVISAGRRTSIKVTIQKDPQAEAEAGRVVCSVCEKDVTDEARENTPPRSAFLPTPVRAVCKKKKDELHQKAQDLLKITFPTVEPSYGALNPQNTPITCHCMNCGADLTEKANSDGLAATFDNALYLCINCAVSLQEKDTGL